MSKKRQENPITDYDILNRILDQELINTPVMGATSTYSRPEHTYRPAYQDYQSNASSGRYSVFDLEETDTWYDAEGNPRSAHELPDNQAIFNSNEKLYIIPEDVYDDSGQLASERITNEYLELGYSPEEAKELGRLEAMQVARANMEETSRIASVLDMAFLGDTYRQIVGSSIVGKKLIPYFHPEQGKWVMKEATQEDLDAGAAAVSAYGPQEESTNFITALTQGLNRTLARTIPGLYDFNEQIMDLGEATWNLATEGNWETEEGATDEIANRNREALESLMPLSADTQDVFGSASGFSSAIGQGLGSLAQYGMLGRIFTGLGLATGSQAVRLLGTNAVRNISRAGMMTAGMVLNSGEAYNAAKEAGLDEGDAALMGLASGAINTALELGFGPNNLQKWLVGGRGARELPKIILEETGGDMSKLASRQSNIIKRAAQRVDNFLKNPTLSTAFEEGSEEFMQSLVNSTGQFLYNYTNLDEGEYGEGLFAPRNIGEVFKDAFSEAAIGAIIGGGLGLIAKNDIQERQKIMPFIVEGKSDLVKSTLTEMLDKGAIDENSYNNFLSRVDQLDTIWNNNKGVFDALEKMEGENSQQVKAAALNLIDQEFSLKQERDAKVAEIAKIRANQELSEAVKDERTKEINVQVNNLNSQITNISNRISELIPDENGNIRAIDRVNRYNEFRDYIVNEANKIVPINEEEYDVLFNFSNLKTDLDNLLSRSLDEGFNNNIRQELRELTGLNNTDQFIENVVQTREAITKAKQREKEKRVQAENRSVKKRQQEIKKKAKQAKEANTVQETDPVTEETESSLETTEEPVVVEDTQVPPDTAAASLQERINRIQTRLDDPNTPSAAKIPLQRQLDRLVEELNAATVNPSEEVVSEIGDVIPEEVESVSEELETSPDQVIEEQSLLTPEEQAVVDILDQEDITNQTKEDNTDGYVKNDIRADSKSNKIVDLTRKREVGNTIISLNINYRQVVDEEQGTSSLIDVTDDQGNLQINENFDSRLQDPQQFGKGTEVTMVVPTYNQMMEAGMRSDYTIEEYNQDRSNSEKLPIAFLDGTGKIIGYLPTTNNVRERVQESFKDAEIIKNQKLRNFVASNPDKSFRTTITRKSTGTPMFVKTNGNLYDRLGNGERFSEGVELAIFKNGKLMNNLSSTVSTGIALPVGMTPDEYFQEGVVYTVVPTADGTNSFALPTNINNIGTQLADTIVRMIQLFRANPQFSRDAALINERNNLSSEIDFTNYQQFKSAVESIIYTNSTDNIFDVDTKNNKIRLGITKDKVFDLNDFMKDEKVRNKVAYELAGRYPAIRLSNFGQRFNTFELVDNQLQNRRYRNYFDYLNDTGLVQTRLQGQPIENTDRLYFTAQSIIEFSDPIVTETVERENTDIVEDIRPQTQDGRPISRLGARPKSKRKTKPDIENDFDLLNNIDENLDQQVEELMRICKSK